MHATSLLLTFAAAFSASAAPTPQDIVIDAGQIQAAIQSLTNSVNTLGGVRGEIDGAFNSLASSWTGASANSLNGLKQSIDASLQTAVEALNTVITDSSGAMSSFQEEEQNIVDLLG